MKNLNLYRNVRRRAAGLIGVLFGSLMLSAFPRQACALPFNQDMAFGQNMVAGSIMRPRVDGTMPVGSLERYVPSREIARTWVSPNNGDVTSVKNGERLFAINCSPCHGVYKDGKHLKSVLAESFNMPAVDLTTVAEKPDGHFFEYIHFGGMAIMPAYGWKLSIQEHWDIVNYIRKFQGK